MEFKNHHLRKAILSDVDDVTCAAKDGDSDWEYIDARIAELGTIGHGNVDIGKIQEHAILLLEKTKDMRVVTHLLRTLQHGKKPHDIALAFSLLADYIEKYWVSSAPPQKLKLRLFKQIIQRFLQAKPLFISESTVIEREIASLQLQRIYNYFTVNHLPIDDDFNQTIQGYALIATENITADTLPAIDQSIPDSNSILTEAQLSNVTSPVMPQVNINQHTDQDWKRTLIKVSEILFERSPGEPIAFQLRRHAIFSTLSEPINRNGITELPPQNADRVAEYKSLAKPTHEQWLKLENSLTVMPWWLEGHYISAQFATRLGFSATADAIKLSLQQFIVQLPAISALCFNDKSRLVTTEMEMWLRQNESEALNQTSDTDAELFECLKTQGYEEALRKLNTQPPGQEMRQQYHQQKLSAQLLSKAGFGVLAAQQAQSLLNGSKHLSIEQWEPSFFAALSALTASSR
ncbi:type VI secretion system protein TssA [Budvicia aquatica]|uniref:Type VI secretion system protein TssA n=1 Tax=Budvicia aquatica TaxID=82979 RepID=A0A2C6CYD0_9GAMM|nr:type VI secretion system protein TssA [Budvicia aquatica]PHI31689.1 type VI secretion system protein TssA [Budvicia aquatica]VFS52434.1 Uncharacterized protein conserved in bacteria [Budvicia aquatica]